MSRGKQSESWYAVHARSNFERRLADQLALHSIETYCPGFKEVSQWADRKKVIERPLFPGYLFARFDAESASRMRVERAAGAVRILGSAAGLEAVPEREIAWIRRIVESGQSCSAHPLMREGSRVRVRRGALRNVEGRLIRFKNQTRLVVSLELLAQSVATEVAISDVELLSPALEAGSLMPCTQT